MRRQVLSLLLFFILPDLITSTGKSTWNGACLWLFESGIFEDWLELEAQIWDTSAHRGETMGWMGSPGRESGVGRFLPEGPKGTLLIPESKTRETEVTRWSLGRR